MIDALAAAFALFVLVGVGVLVVGVFVTVRRRLGFVPPLGKGAHDE